MWARIIFCTSVLLAVLVVILLALFSPTPQNTVSKDQEKQPWLDLSLYIQRPRIGSHSAQPVGQSDVGALIFHRMLTEGPENTSRVVGKAQGFIIPVEQFADSDFNIVHLSFDMPEYSGSLSVQAKHIAHKDTEELMVVGGTGSFAFARGVAVFVHTVGDPNSSYGVDATFHVKLQLRFPIQSRTIRG